MDIIPTQIAEYGCKTLKLKGNVSTLTSYLWFHFKFNVLEIFFFFFFLPLSKYLRILVHVCMYVYAWQGKVTCM